PVQLPGRANRIVDAPHLDAITMASDVAEGIGAYLDMPYAFFGHSMGAMLSYELVVLLRKRRMTGPLRLFISARRAPNVPYTDAAVYDLPEDEFINELRRLKGTPPEVFESPELLELLLPVLRADFQVCQTYRNSGDSPLDVPITVFGALDDTEVSRPALEEWRRWTSVSFAIHMLPGDHFFLHSRKPLLLNLLSRELDGILEGLAYCPP
ncbi:MAG TPA: thioesterase domain-containing protein, partial [Blastocatellia bacterium]|nr:thioesterase domain-containing protein [Blastocatellia bacterium]